MIRVLIADDQTIVRAGFAALLAAQPDIDVVAQGGDGREAVRLTETHRPDVVLMDIRMPGMDGIDATRRILADPANAATRVLVLTTFDVDEYVYEALSAGASGFLLKDSTADDLVSAVHVVARGDALLAPSVTRTLISEFATGPAPADPAAGRDALTAREQEIVQLVARGLSNDELAERMVISPLTVKTHINRAMSKLHCRDRAQLVVWAYESGLVAPRHR
jgi:DNA-binding NarL/FixJ family response regulator